MLAALYKAGSRWGEGGGRRGDIYFQGLAEIESIATLNIDIRHPISLLSRVGNFRGANKIRDY
jgi:hypothetical protein